MSLASSPLPFSCPPPDHHTLAACGPPHPIVSKCALGHRSETSPKVPLTLTHPIISVLFSTCSLQPSLLGLELFRLAASRLRLHESEHFGIKWWNPTLKAEVWLTLDQRVLEQVPKQLLADPSQHFIFWFGVRCERVEPSSSILLPPLPTPATCTCTSMYAQFSLSLSIPSSLHTFFISQTFFLVTNPQPLPVPYSCTSLSLIILKVLRCKHFRLQ